MKLRTKLAAVAASVTLLAALWLAWEAWSLPGTD